MASMDPSDMLSKIQSFPSQLHQGWDIGKDTIRSLDLSRYRSIVFSGMGGSAVAGDLIQAFLFEQWAIPFFINRDYRLPGFLNTKTLFVASSYSGNTEETLSSLRQAQEAGCDVICLASGGKLSEEAEKKDYPLFKIPGGNPPLETSKVSLIIRTRAWASQSRKSRCLKLGALTECPQLTPIAPGTASSVL